MHSQFAIQYAGLAIILASGPVALLLRRRWAAARHGLEAWETYRSEKGPAIASLCGRVLRAGLQQMSDEGE
jgi:hypothetical protein